MASAREQVRKAILPVGAALVVLSVAVLALGAWAGTYCN
jgi:hypothetical protein